MYSSNLPTWVSSKPSNSTKNQFFYQFNQNPFLQFSNRLTPKSISRSPSPFTQIHCRLRELRKRIETVKSTQKFTEAMKLVAAARIRRAQEAVINGRPFTEALVEFLYTINDSLQCEDVDCPLTVIRPVKKVALVVITGDRGLCGKKGNSYFRRKDDVLVDRFVEGGGFPTAKEAQMIADDVFSLFISEEVDKVELVYTKFVSLVKSNPVIRTLLPLSSVKGEVVDVNGNCVDGMEDELFMLTTKGGKLVVERDKVRVEGGGISPLMQFEQDPVQILDAMMPLYLNSQILRALQESLASELAARMNAMSNATVNAIELKKNLSIVYNRERQAKITSEILEIVAGAEALT
ncbi:ATP synthase gamma chain [Hibiscus syriacus]|uniref:ATP synthase gamma chain n=1 Tax=Hibiscus syriacus TaxID=106335 RepID=A0A6A2XWS1_HIBSY|nr:ATP synthase gamma chain [Hibiscus syriacus]